ncbi:membrane protein insertase YidC [Kitasatospora xanthocidica]|uniref:Membrane protein insertase YidC n=1 Tax=Kitasatospora xanthocidica TaxID=83382 RepID=A0A372ZV69_9ACTN|nr:membrane protein insertase YidC [Kitasatospora xanthocidica]RGD59786.1 membrane protein insertase YidC [Kitasatospora xanthocidica]
MSVLAVLDPAVAVAHAVVAAVAHLVPTALAIVLFTVAVRLALHPLARAAARGERARARLAPKVAALQRKHRDRPERLREALAEMYRKEQVSPFAGCLPVLVQIPFFSVMYRLFTTPNDLLDHTLFGVPLGLHVTGAQGAGQWAVFGVLFAGLAAVGVVNFRRARRTAAAAAATAQPAPQPGAGLLPYLSFGSVLFAALVPVAAVLYLLTTGVWSAAERAWLYRDGTPVPAAAMMG